MPALGHAQSHSQGQGTARQLTAVTEVDFAALNSFGGMSAFSGTIVPPVPRAGIPSANALKTEPPVTSPVTNPQEQLLRGIFARAQEPVAAVTDAAAVADGPQGWVLPI